MRKRRSDWVKGPALLTITTLRLIQPGDLVKLNVNDTEFSSRKQYVFHSFDDDQNFPVNLGRPNDPTSVLYGGEFDLTREEAWQHCCRWEDIAAWKPRRK